VKKSEVIVGEEYAVGRRRAWGTPPVLRVRVLYGASHDKAIRGGGFGYRLRTRAVFGWVCQALEKETGLNDAALMFVEGREILCLWSEHLGEVKLKRERERKERERAEHTGGS
jgi:hypothetical protein